MRFFIFIFIVTTTLALSTFYVGARFIHHSLWGMTHQGTVWISLGLFIFSQFMGPYLYRTFPNQHNRLFIFEWLAYTAMGIFTCLFFYTLAADLLIFLIKIIFSSSLANSFEHWSLAGIGLITFSSVIIGTLQVAKGPKVLEVEIPLTKLPQAFDGFRIVQISDLHIGPTIGKSYAEKVVTITNQLNPDLVALTGDFVDGTIAQLRSSLEPLTQIKANEGVFFITGNHEYYWGAPEWILEFQKLGARTLINEHVIIRRQESEFVLAGVTDHSAGRILSEHTSDPVKALEGAPAHSIKILLAHNPSSYKGAEQAGFDLQLSGHTHGGQFFPWNLVVRLVHRYSQGLHRFNNMWIYVNRGTGYWGPPMRFGVPSEITLIRLKYKEALK